MNEFEHKRTSRPGASSDKVSDRLQKLSPARADRILRRAIELQSDSDYDDAELDVETLNRVADELGVHRDIVAKALSEELAKPDERPPASIQERIFGPTEIADQTLVTGPADSVNQSIGSWMSKHEGMQITRSDGQTSVWVKRSSPMNSIRQGLKLSQGTGSLRTVEVAHRVETVTPDQHVVSLRANTNPAHWVGKGLTVGGAVAGMATGIALGATVGLSIGIIGGLGALVVLGGSGIIGARSWIRQIRRGMQRALTGIAHPDLASQETVGDAVMDIIGQFTKRR